MNNKEKDLNKVLNYMKQYVEDKYEHDSEPMLNYKDLQLVLDEIERLNKEIEKYNQMVQNTYETSQEMLGEQEQELKEANDSITWWQNRFNAIERENIRLNNIINELEEYINPFLYMLNGITDKDEYEQAQLDTFTDIMEKLQELKGSDKE